MRVLVDAHMLGSHETGNEAYIRNLLRALARRDDVDILAAVLPSEVARVEEMGVAAAPLARESDFWRLAKGLNGLAREHGADLMHVTYVGPLLPICPLVVTVHDVSFRRFPSYFAPRVRLLFATLLPATLRRAARVITVSQHARQEILRYYPHLQGRVGVTFEAADPIFRRLDGALVAETLDRLGVAPPYVLAVGNLQPRKNLARLVQAFAEAGVAADARLVIVGQAQWQASDVTAAIEEARLGNAVKLTGYVSDDDLVALYNGAALFCYPSLYEGFGLPVAEAMACGAPVVASNVTSIPEVAGDAALLADPYDVTAMAQAIGAVLQDDALAASLRQRGLARAAPLTWDQTAEQTVACYWEALNHAGKGGSR